MAPNPPSRGQKISLSDIEASFRRPPGPGGMIPPQGGHPHHPGGLTHQQQQQQYAQQHDDFRKQREINERAKSRSKVPVDRDIPDGVEELVIGDGVQQYNSLRNAERKLDAIMMRKRLDIQDSVQKAPVQLGTMRIWISNTCDNQPWQASGMDPDAFDFSSGADATFRMKIEGRLLEDFANSADEDGSETQNGTGASDAQNGTNNNEDEPVAKRPRLGPSAFRRKKFSHFFKSITIDFDRSSTLQPDQYTQIEWKRPEYQPSAQMDPPKEADFDCLEFERKSDVNINVTIKLVRASSEKHPERYKLAQPLAELLDMEEADRKTVLMGIWEYSRANGLQVEGDERRINCDDRLRSVFDGREQILFREVSEMIRDMMFEPPPISLDYTIRVDRDFQNASDAPQPTIYDIPVPLDDTLRAQMDSIINSPTHTPMLRNIAASDDRIALIVQRMNEAKAKHGFFTSMSKDPVSFVKRWVSSQKRDLDVILGAGTWGDEDWQSATWRKGGDDGPWGSQEAWEGVGSYLTRVHPPKNSDLPEKLLELARFYFPRCGHLPCY